MASAAPCMTFRYEAGYGNMLRRIRMAGSGDPAQWDDRPLWAGCADRAITFAQGGKPTVILQHCARGM
ncbi:hypothetical protein BD293_3795 [Roseinatronobacter monicus]|uniref:Uncharacterized protein n=1 Tax=Roseinatronobacter monicus TaxID=393481 RepID=A0A543K5S3_9RHOB|nr:hypothetical protein BD293_3795 [Roseinatronobacter monicus]